MSENQEIFYLGISGLKVHLFAVLNSFYGTFFIDALCNRLNATKIHLET